MREYETTIIVQPEISEEGSQAIFEKLDEILNESNSIRLQCESLGKRKLAYEIRKFHKGHYYILSYLSDGQVVPAVERSLRLNESILRFMTILANPKVADIEARKAEAAEQEAEQARIDRKRISEGSRLPTHVVERRRRPESGDEADAIEEGAEEERVDQAAVEQDSEFFSFHGATWVRAEMERATGAATSPGAVLQRRLPGKSVFLHRPGRTAPAVPRMAKWTHVSMSNKQRRIRRCLPS